MSELELYKQLIAHALINSGSNTKRIGLMKNKMSNYEVMAKRALGITGYSFTILYFDDIINY